MLLVIGSARIAEREESILPSTFQGQLLNYKLHLLALTS